MGEAGGALRVWGGGWGQASQINPPKARRGTIQIHPPRQVKGWGGELWIVEQILRSFLYGT
jgi:23S rRNA A2030 N6-methylase RlmJ